MALIEKNMSLENIFKQFGLGSREVKVYNSCLNRKRALVSDIQKDTKLSRSTVYYVLDALIENKFISVAVKGKKKTYSVENPENIKLNLENRQAMIAESLKEFDSILPILNKSIQKNKKSIMRFYEGAESITKLQTNLFKQNPDTKVFIFSSKQNEDSKNFKRIFKNSIKSRLKNNIFANIITPVTKTKISLKKFESEQLRETKYLPEDKFPFSSDIIIFPNFIHICSFGNDDSSFSILIEDESMVQTMKMIFDLCWEAAAKYDKEIMRKYQNSTVKK